MFIAWDADGQILATLDALIYHDPKTGEMAGMVDMQTHEATGGRMREIAEVEGAIGAGTWIEELGGQAHDFKVELDPEWTREDPAHPFYVQALRHKSSRVKRKREVAEKRILAEVKAAREAGRVPDLEPVIGLARVAEGGPDRYLRLGPDGRDAPVAPATAESPIATEAPPFPLLQPAAAVTAPSPDPEPPPEPTPD